MRTKTLSPLGLAAASLLLTGCMNHCLIHPQTSLERLDQHVSNAPAERDGNGDGARDSG